MGLHRRTSVILINHKNYSECGYCGADLIRSRRGWRRIRLEELPEGWSEKPLMRTDFGARHLIIAVILLIGVAGVTLFL